MHDATEPQGLHLLSPFKWYPHTVLEWEWSVSYKGFRVFSRDRVWVDKFFTTHAQRTENFSGSQEFSDRAKELKRTHVATFAILFWLVINFALTP